MLMTIYRKYLFLNNYFYFACASALLLAAPLALAQTNNALAQLLPQRPILMIVPNAAGGPSDYIARVIVPKLSEATGQNIVVDNRASANGLTATEYAARATPNGSVLAVGNTGTHAINATLYKKPPYDPVRDFAPVAAVVSSNLVLVINARSPLANFRDFIALANKHPGTVNLGIAGATGEIATNALKLAAGIDINNVPYKGGVPAMIAVMSGEIHATITTSAGAITQVESGKLRAIGVTGVRRDVKYPGVPTFMESGVEGYAIDMWFGLFAPAKTPPRIVQAYHREIARIVALPEIKERLLAQGYEILDSTPEQFAAVVKRDTDKYRKIIVDSKMQQLE